MADVYALHEGGFGRAVVLELRDDLVAHAHAESQFAFWLGGASVEARLGDTVVLAAVTVSDNQSPLPFFPLTVEYKEKSYAAGKIPGGFIKREGRPHDDEILSARIIDRSIRPLFPEGFKNEVQVFVYVMSDDNYFFLQRTLLMEFELSPE